LLYFGQQGRDNESKTIQQRRDNFNNKWKGLQGALSTYRETLAGALEIHLFNRDIDDTNQRVIEKSVAMNTSDTGKDLPAVEQLQRKQEAMERDMTAIEGKLKVKIALQLKQNFFISELIIINLYVLIIYYIIKCTNN